MADGAAADAISKSASRLPAERVAVVLCRATAVCDPDKRLPRQKPAIHLPTCSFPTAATKNRQGRGRDGQAGRPLTHSTRLPTAAGSVSENCAGYFGSQNATAPVISHPL